MAKKHGNLSLSERNRYRVDDIPAQIECLGCDGVFSYYGPSLINHISRCVLSIFVQNASRTVGDVFPVTVADATTVTGNVYRGKAAASAERSKRLKYRPILDSPNVTFIPFAIECNGHIDGEVLAVFSALRQRSLDPQAFPSFM